MMDRFSPSSVSTIRGSCHMLGVAAQDDVVEAAGDVEVGFADHWTSVVNERPICN
jgi:hypothetical protein